MNATFKQAKIITEDGLWLCLKVNEAAPVRAFVYNIKWRSFRGMNLKVTHWMPLPEPPKGE